VLPAGGVGLPAGVPGSLTGPEELGLRLPPPQLTNDKESRQIATSRPAPAWGKFFV
jgi:hypothetical protein